ncbi:fad-type 2 protein [Rutstroemia sp. NJR-2017a BVV2]|nr:fad-type 2 protein [Rutstroemia sp. NJR-2017a BVV2]
MNQLWNLNLSLTQFQSETDSLDHEIYFRYYAEQCNQALHDAGRHTSAREHRDIIEVSQHFKDNLHRNDIFQKLMAKLPARRQGSDGREMTDGTIDLAARLFLMMDFGDLKHGFKGQHDPRWMSDSLRHFLSQFLEPPARQYKVKLEKIFNARNLGRISGIEIEWTSNMKDHLKLMDGDKKVALFHHASFLEYQHNNLVFPPDFIGETLRTLALLLPQNDELCKTWFKKISARQRLDSKAIRCGRLRAEDRQIEKFKFWGERLCILKELFDEAEPSSLSQWWYDRRKRVQWYTFWVAILVLVLTVFFGMVQSIEGALQAYKAFHPS